MSKKEVAKSDLPMLVSPAVVLGWRAEALHAPECLFTGMSSRARRFFEANKKSKDYVRIEWHNLGANTRRAKRGVK